MNNSCQLSIIKDTFQSKKWERSIILRFVKRYEINSS